jgi:hypothetical protein
MRTLLMSCAGVLVLGSVACATTGTTVVPITETMAAADTGMTPRHTTPIVPLPDRVMHPLLQQWSGPHGGVPPWDRLEPALFPGAFEEAIALRAAEIRAIAENPAAPTFANTFVPLQNAGRALSRTNVLFSVMTSNVNTPEYQASTASGRRVWRRQPTRSPSTSRCSAGSRRSTTAARRPG